MGLRDWLSRRAHLPAPPREDDCPRERLRQVEKRRRDAYRRGPAVDALATRLDEKRRQNHFGETIDAIYRRRNA